MADLSIVRPDAPDFAISAFLTTPCAFSDAFCRWFLRHGGRRNVMSESVRAVRRQQLVRTADKSESACRISCGLRTPHDILSVLRMRLLLVLPPPYTMYCRQEISIRVARVYCHCSKLFVGVLTRRNMKTHRNEAMSMANRCLELRPKRIRDHLHPQRVNNVRPSSL